MHKRFVDFGYVLRLVAYGVEEETLPLEYLSLVFVLGISKVSDLI
jgi:hypothetical protein